MTDKDLLTELNRDIYQPFSAAYRWYDTEAVVLPAVRGEDDLHSAGAVRTAGGGPRWAWNGIGPDPPWGIGTD